MIRTIALIATLVVCNADLGDEASPQTIPAEKPFSVRNPYYEKEMLVYLNAEGRIEVSLQPFGTPTATYGARTFSNLNMEEVDAAVLRGCAYDGTNIRVIDIIRGGTNNDEITFVERFANVATSNGIGNRAPHGWTYRTSLFYVSDKTLRWYDLANGNALKETKVINPFYRNTHIHPSTEDSIWIIGRNEIESFKFPSESYKITIRSVMSDVPEAANDFIHMIGVTDGILFAVLQYSPEITIIDTTSGSYTQAGGKTIRIPRGCINMDASDKIAYLGCVNYGGFMIDATGSNPVVKEIVFNPTFTSSDYILKIYDDTLLMTAVDSRVFSIYPNKMDGTDATLAVRSTAIPSYNYEKINTYHLTSTNVNNIVLTTDGSVDWLYKSSITSEFSQLSATGFTRAPGYVSQSFYDKAVDELYTISYSNDANHFTVFESASGLPSAISQKNTSGALPQQQFVVFNDGYLVSGDSATRLQVWDFTFELATYGRSVGTIVVENTGNCLKAVPVGVFDRKFCFYSTCSSLVVADFSDIANVRKASLIAIRAGSDSDVRTAVQDAAGVIWIVNVGQAVSLYQFNKETSSLTLRGSFAREQVTFFKDIRAIKVFYVPEKKAIIVAYSFGFVAAITHDAAFKMSLQKSWYHSGSIIDARLVSVSLYTYSIFPAEIVEISMFDILGSQGGSTPVPPTPPTNVLRSIVLTMTMTTGTFDCGGYVAAGSNTAVVQAYVVQAFGSGVRIGTLRLSCVGTNLIASFSYLGSSTESITYDSQVLALKGFLQLDPVLKNFDNIAYVSLVHPNSAGGLSASVVMLLLCVLSLLL